MIWTFPPLVGDVIDGFLQGTLPKTSSNFAPTNGGFQVQGLLLLVSGRLGQFAQGTFAPKRGNCQKVGPRTSERSGVTSAPDPNGRQVTWVCLGLFHWFLDPPCWWKRN